MFDVRFGGVIEVSQMDNWLQHRVMVPVVHQHPIRSEAPFVSKTF
jgi:hypothetical protein